MNMDSGSESLDSSPAERTVYVSNLPYALTQTDLHQLFKGLGHIENLKILTRRDTRKSRGVAFIQFRTVQEASRCILTMNSLVFGNRMLKCSFAIDNGKSRNYITKKTSPAAIDKCFQCGVPGHISYTCPKNVMGTYFVNKVICKRPKKRKIGQASRRNETPNCVSESIDSSEEEVESLDEEPRQSPMNEEVIKKKVYKKSSYFSDEEYLSE